MIYCTLGYLAKQCEAPNQPFSVIYPSSMCDNGTLLPRGRAEEWELGSSVAISSNYLVGAKPDCGKYLPDAEIRVKDSIEALLYFPKCANVIIANPNKNFYTGWRKVPCDEVTMAKFYSDPELNWVGALNGQYILVADVDGQLVDTLRWNGEIFERLRVGNFSSDAMGVCKPKDVYQQCLFDSLIRNNMTIVHGRAGAGKTLIPMAWLMKSLERGEIDTCYFVHHFEKLKHSVELGFVKGTQEDKLLQTGSIGNILSSKLGDMEAVRNWMHDGRIVILPTGNIRGFESGKNDVIFCTEAQDLDPYTLKTIIQRYSDGGKIIIEGDICEQTDISRRSGFAQVIDTFKGVPGVGCVKLEMDYRSQFGRLADNIK